MVDGKQKKDRRGRPKKDVTLQSRITIRLDKESEETLEKYCLKNSITKAEAIRVAISLLK